MMRFDKNGHSSYNEDSDFKRKNSNRDIEEEGPTGGGPENDAQVPLNEKANEYIRDCLLEKDRLDNKYPIAEKLLESEIEKVHSSGRIPIKEYFANIYREKPMRVAQKVLVPIREHPKFNFVGKILGPKGNSLRRLQEETLCKMAILGKNSMKDRAKEEELRSSGDPKYAHLNKDLHVEISTIAPPSEAYARIAYALAELRKYLIPDSNDEIRQEQLRELQGAVEEEDPNKYRKPSYPPPKSYPPYRAPPPPPSFPKSSKPKVMSILEKARSAMDESYRGYEHDHYEHPPYEGYSYHAPHASHSPHGGRGGYEMEYEPEYRREYHPRPSTYTKPSAAMHNSRSSTYRPPPSHYPPVPSRRHDDSGSRSREAVRYRAAPYIKPK